MHPAVRGRDTVVFAVTIPPARFAAPTRLLASRSLLSLSSNGNNPASLQAIAAVLRRAFQNNSPIASMFSKFQAMPFRNAAA